MKQPKLILLAALVCVPAITRAATVITSLPYSITTPGAYVLGSDLTAHGTDGIDVKASNVSINLNGYTLAGDAGSNDTNGIYVTSGGTNVSVQNGTISGFYTGIDFLTGSQDVVKNVQLLGVAWGVVLNGSSSLVENCFIVGTRDIFGTGITSNSDNVLIRDNQISEFSTGITGPTIAMIRNSEANCTYGISGGPACKYQGNITINCPHPVLEGIAVGHENG